MAKKGYIKNYRIAYSRFFGLEIPEGYEVHHIDYDRNNNDPWNLVALPKELHRKLHQKRYEYLRWKDYGVHLASFMFNPGTCECLYYTIEYYNAIEECRPFIEFRDLMAARNNLSPFRKGNIYEQSRI